MTRAWFALFVGNFMGTVWNLLIVIGDPSDSSSLNAFAVLVGGWGSQFAWKEFHKWLAKDRRDDD